MEAHEDHMALAKLHPDIMRKIILIEFESVDELRLISKSWNAEIFDLFNIRSNRKYPRDGIVEAVANVRKTKNAGLANAAPDFELFHSGVSKRPMYIRNLPWDIPAQPAPRPRPRHDILLCNRIKFADKFKPTNENNSDNEEITEKVRHSLESLRRMFLRISGIKICTLFDMTAADLKLIAKAMRNLPMNELFISMRICDEEIRAAILEILKYAKIERLAFHAHYCTRKNLRDDNIAFYGIPRAFWANSARQMLNNGLGEFAFGRHGPPGLMMHLFRNEDSQAETNDEARLNVSF